jgi:hypothetical protein
MIPKLPFDLNAHLDPLQPIIGLIKRQDTATLSSSSSHI